MLALVVSPDRPERIQLVRDYPMPRPRPDEVLIRVSLAGLCATDLEIARGYLRFTGVPGHEFVGIVEQGPRELVGERVVAEINCACGRCDACRRGAPNHCPQRTVLGIAGRNGSFAEYLTLPVQNCHRVPTDVSDEQAVFVEPLAAAAHVLDASPIDPSQRVAVLGTGRLGLLVAQVLAATRCRLLVVGRNPSTLALCTRWGLPAVHVDNLAVAAEYDAVVDCTGSPDGLRLALRLCRPCGTIVLKSTYAEAATLDLAPLVIHELHVVGSRCGSVCRALQLLSARSVRVAELVSAVYPLEQGVEALAAAGRPENVKVLLRPGAA